MKQRVIFTGADARFIDLFLDMFYPTLRQFGCYRDDVKVLLLGKVKRPILRALRQQNLAIETDSERADLHQIWKFEYAARLHREYEEVYFFDCDFWFQSDVHPLFEQVQPGKLTVSEENNAYQRERLLQESDFDERNVKVMTRDLPEPVRDRMLRQLVGRRVINGGFFGGRLLGAIHKALLHTCQGWPRIGFGFNQTIMNLWAYGFPETVHRLPARYIVALSYPPRGLRSNSDGRLRVGSKLAIALHANNCPTPETKLAEPRFRRLIEAHRDFNAGLEFLQS